jgi:hypothetical protein
MTSDQRKFYVLGIMEALYEAGVTATVAAAICHDLKLTAEDMKVFSERKKDAAK